jgi:hypothetical protein
LLEVTASTNIDGVAGINASQKTARILLGNNFFRRGSRPGSDEIGNIGISLVGLDNAAYLCPSGRIKVEVFQIPETSSALPDGPELKQKFYIEVDDNAAYFTIAWETWADAYTIKITPYR